MARYYGMFLIFATMMIGIALYALPGADATMALNWGSEQAKKYWEGRSDDRPEPGN
ncbi:uncharacterized protein LOC144149179 [Haemaphysalis longicornis]